MKKSIHRIMLLAVGLPVLMAVSQKADFVTVLQEKLKTFYERRNGVKVHLILNQPEYVAGDTAFFMTYVLDGQSLKPVSGKRILNLELFDRKQEKLLHQRIVCKDGLGAGQLVLPEIQAGNYALIVYGDDAADPLVPSSVFQTEIWIGGEKELAKKQSSMAFFPEGGNLVANVRTKVVALIPGGVTVARIIDSSGKSIIQFTTASSGLGSFYITPQPGERYYVESPAEKKELVETKQDGAGLNVEDDIEGRDLRVSVEVPSGSHWRGEELYLVLTSHGSIGFSKSIVLEKDAPTTVTVPRSDCAEGVAQLTLFTSKGDVLAERLVFIEPKPLEVQLSLDANQYQVRNPVKVDIRLKDFKGLPTGSNLSLTVYKDDLFPNSKRVPNFKESVFLESDLAPGLISFPDLTKTTAAELSDYLITRQWGSFQWTDVFTEKEGNPSRSPVSPYYFKGRVVSTSGTAIRDSTAISVYLNRNDFVYVIYTKKNGEFEFPLFMDFNNDDLFCAIHYNGKAIHDAYISLQGSPGFPGFVPVAVAGANDDPYTGFSKSKKPILTSFRYYLSKPTKNNLAEAEYAEFDEVDIEADLGKYKKFSSMTEVLVEVVPAVKHKKVKDQDAVRVFLQESAMYAQEDPLYFIDGEITDSTAYFLALDPDRISRIKVLRSVKTLRRFGDLGKNGIVIVETKSPDRSHHIPRSKRILRVTGVTPPIFFKSPDYSRSIQNEVPDLRSTLFWKPQLTTDKEGRTSVSFYTGDATGSFLVRVEGITSTSQPFSREAHFTVSLDRP